MGVSGQRHAPAALPRERHPVPLVQEAERAPEPLRTGAENLGRTGIRSLDGEPVANSYITTPVDTR
jgi:hypothetical protein